LENNQNIKVFQVVGMDQMEQRSAALFLGVKGLLKKPIHHELVAVLLENAASYSSSSVARFYREAILGLNSEEASLSPKDDGLDEVNEAILLTLPDEPFSSVPSIWHIARRICIPKTR
jgi:hypothetical protein